MNRIFMTLAVFLLFCVPGFSGDFSLENIRDISLKVSLRTYGDIDFTKIKKLNLNKSQIRDISGISNLVQLERLELYYNYITNIDALSGMVNLKILHIGKNKVEDLGPLSNLVSLETLDINHNPARNIQVLSGLYNIKEIDMRGDQYQLESFKYWNFTNTLGFYDFDGKYQEIPVAEKEKWGLRDGKKVKAYY